MTREKLVPQWTILVRPTYAADVKLRLDYDAFRRRHDTRSPCRRHVGCDRILCPEAAVVVVEENRVCSVGNQVAGIQMELLLIGNADQL